MHPPNILPIRYEGPGAPHDALQLRTRHGTVLIALQGAHLLSWAPSGQQEVLWLSPDSLPEPAAIRGGVPICWPWFAKQGRASSAAQHGPVRNLRWEVSKVHAADDDGISLSMVPALQAASLASGSALTDGVPPGLTVRMDLHLGSTLRQSLHTVNQTGAPFLLTQALHTYYAVNHAQKVRIDGLQGLDYTDRLRDLASDVQRDPFALEQACDRTYAHPEGSEDVRRYAIQDADWQRRIDIEVQGSRSVVVWNPGEQIARQMVDVPDQGWPGFFCVEATNAGPDVIALQPGESHTLTQILSVERL